MDSEKKPSTLTYTSQTIPPALLFVGDTTTIHVETELFLMRIFCESIKSGTAQHALPIHTEGVEKQDQILISCNSCKSCIQIKNRQHHSILWIRPERGYTIDSLEDLFSTIAFQITLHDHFFFVLDKADLLTGSTANKLLKPIEEPPTGYHFILLAQNADAVLPTLRSRCIMHNFTHSDNQYSTHPLFLNFTSQQVTAIEFHAIIDKIKIDEYETKELVNSITKYWIDIYKKRLLTKEQSHQSLQSIESIITIFLTAQNNLPMPGSSGLFWKHLYLTLNHYFQY